MLNNLMKTRPVDLETIFHPGSIAVYGASGGFLNAGTRFIMSFQESGFPGPIYAVNPKGSPAENFPTFKTLVDIPGPVDHVYIAVPAGAVIDVVKDCVAKGVHSAIVFSSGFREIGTSEGLAMEKEITKIARAGGVRLFGPNCMGIYCPQAKLSYRVDFKMMKSPLSFISQSGGVAITGVNTAEDRGVGFEKVVSFGNECDVTSAEMITHLEKDPATEIIMAYIEGSGNPRRLISAMEQAGRKKPVIVLKSGMSEEGNRAVSSHTGALAGSQSAWEAALKQANAINAQSFDEFIDTALTFHRVKRPAGKRLCIISISGGMCVLLTDLAIRMGFEVPTLSRSTMGGLKEFFPGVGTSVKNPIDLAATFFNPGNLNKLFSILDKDDQIDAIVFLISIEFVISIDKRIPGFMDTMAQVFAEEVSKVEKPIMTSVLYSTRDDIRRDFVKPLVDHKQVVYPTVDRALSSLKHMMRYYNIRDQRHDKGR